MDLDTYPERHFVPDYDETTEESNGSDHNVTDSSSASASKHKRKRWRKKEWVTCVSKILTQVDTSQESIYESD